MRALPSFEVLLPVKSFPVLKFNGYMIKLPKRHTGNVNVIIPALLQNAEELYIFIPKIIFVPVPVQSVVPMTGTTLIKSEQLLNGISIT